MKIIFLVLITILNLLFWFNSDYVDLIFLPLLSFIICIISIFPDFKDNKIELKLIHFIVVGILFFNTPLYIQYLFDNEFVLSVLMNLRIDFKYFIKASILLAISLPLIILGYSFKTFKNQVSKKHKVLYVINNRMVFICILITFVLLFLSISFTGLQIGATYIGTSSYYYILLNKMILLTAAIISYQYIKGFLGKRNKFLCFVLFILYLSYLFIGGDRGPILSVFLVLLFAVLYKNKMSFKSVQLFTLCFISLVFISLFQIIEVLRLSNDSSLNASLLIDSYNVSKSEEKINGVIIRCTSLAIEGIDNYYYPHTYGLFFIENIFNGVPYLGNKFLSIFSIPDFLSYGSAHLLTTQYSGFNYSSGIGTTYLADLYIEFGLIGVMIISFIYGYMVNYLDFLCKNKINNFFSFLFIAFFVAFSIYTGRSILWSFLVNFIFSFVLFNIIYVFFGNFKKK